MNLNEVAAPKRKRAGALQNLAAAAAVALVTHSAYAQTWQTVDTYQYIPGLSAGNYGLTVAPSGVVFASGYGDDGTNGEHGLVLASADGGNTWSDSGQYLVYLD